MPLFSHFRVFAYFHDMKVVLPVIPNDVWQIFTPGKCPREMGNVTTAIKFFFLFFQGMMTSMAFTTLLVVFPTSCFVYTIIQDFIPFFLYIIIIIYLNYFIYSPYSPLAPPAGHTISLDLWWYAQASSSTLYILRHQIRPASPDVFNQLCADFFPVSLCVVCKKSKHQTIIILNQGYFMACQAYSTTTSCF